MSRNFRSDNITPVCKPIMAAMHAANVDSVASYGGDRLSEDLHVLAGKIFEAEVAVFPVATGTAANALALSHLVPPYGAVYCHAEAHIATDECGAPEFFTGGSKIVGFRGPHGKLRASDVASAVALAKDMGVHHVKPGAMSITQATEWGTVYGLDEVAALTSLARSEGLPVHMDGARFANALVHLGCSPAQATWKRGIDVLSLGATKNGAMCAEAVVFFDRERARDFDRRRKRAGHLWSKLRFLSAQLLAYLSDDLWLQNARHANTAAATLAQGLRSVEGCRLLQPVEANEVFATLPERTVAALETQGFGFYRWPFAAPSGVAIRLVTSYATSLAAVEEFTTAARRCS